MLRKIEEGNINYIEKNQDSVQIFIKTEQSMEHEEQKIFVERYEVHQEEERQIYLVNVEGNFINKDVNRM